MVTRHLQSRPLTHYPSFTSIRYLAEVLYEGPVVVTNYPKGIKAFYMKLDRDAAPVRETVQGKEFVACFMLFLRCLKIRLLTYFPGLLELLLPLPNCASFFSREVHLTPVFICVPVCFPTDALSTMYTTSRHGHIGAAHRRDHRRQRAGRRLRAPQGARGGSWHFRGAIELVSWDKGMTSLNALRMIDFP